MNSIKMPLSRIPMIQALRAAANDLEAGAKFETGSITLGEDPFTIAFTLEMGEKGEEE